MPRRPSLPEVDEELSTYIASQPPPPMLAHAKARLAARVATGEPLDTPTGRHLLEDVQEQVRAAAVRAAEDKMAETRQRAADKIAEAKERAERAEKALEKAGDRRWDLVLLVVTAVLGVLCGHFFK